MILTSDQIARALQQISKNVLLYIGFNLGEAVFSTADQALLNELGVNFMGLGGGQPRYYRMYLLGRLTQVLGEYNSARLAYNDFEEYLRRAQFQPLTPFEEFQYQAARQATYGHLKHLEHRMRQDTETGIMEEITRAEYEGIFKQGMITGVKERETLSNIVSNIGHQTGDWAKDLGRIVDTEMNNIFQKGRMMEIIKASPGQDPLVYKDVYPGACRHCIALYLTGGLGSAPRVFKLSELIANGSNVGRKVKDWRPTVEGLHPFCFLNSRVKIYTVNGWIAISDIQIGDMVLTHKGRFRKVTSLIQHLYKTEKIYNIKVKIRNRIILLSGITGSHPILTNNGWINVDKLQKTDKISFGELKCTECGKSFPIYTEGSEGIGKGSSVNTCSVICNTNRNNKLIKKTWENSEYCKEQNKIRSKRVQQLFQERPEIKDHIKEGVNLRFLNMPFEERCNLTKKANQVVRNQVASGEFNFSEEFLNPKTGQRSGTSLERKMKWLLSKLGIEFVEQFEILRNKIGCNGQKRKYYVDFYIPKYNLIIECDGYYHNSKEHKIEDIQRDLEIKKLIGAETIRFSEKEIKQNLGECFKKVNRILSNHEGLYSEECSGEIISIEERTGSQLNCYFRQNKKRILYNFSVDEDESYIANGIVVHNCRCTLRHLIEGMIWSILKKQFVYDKAALKREETRLGITGKVKVMVGDREFNV
jgi:very-short-patch-repair endonuclease